MDILADQEEMGMGGIDELDENGYTNSGNCERVRSKFIPIQILQVMRKVWEKIIIVLILTQILQVMTTVIATKIIMTIAILIF